MQYIERHKLTYNMCIKDCHTKNYWQKSLHWAMIRKKITLKLLYAKQLGSEFYAQIKNLLAKSPTSVHNRQGVMKTIAKSATS